MAPESSSRALRIGLDGRYLDAHHPGIGRYVFELAQALPEALDGLALDVLVRRTPPSRFDPRCLESAGAATTVTDDAPRGLGSPWRLARTARSMGVALWHAPFFATSFGVGVPRVVTVYDTIGLLNPNFLVAGWRRLAYRLLLGAALARATCVITLSNAAAEDLRRRLGVAPKRLSVTPAGVAENFRPPTAEAVSSLRARLSLPARFALFLGADRPHKNLTRLCRAWRRIADADAAADCHLVLAGFPRDGRDRSDQDTRIRALGSVAEDDLPTLLGTADLFVLPSLTEGFGLPVLEAMACGTPVVCARAGSLVEVAGEAAEYFDPLEIESIAGAMSRLLTDPEARDRLAVRGRLHAASFTWRRTAEATAALYRQVLGLEAEATG